MKAIFVSNIAEADPVRESFHLQDILPLPRRTEQVHNVNGLACQRVNDISYNYKDEVLIEVVLHVGLPTYT